VNTRKSFADYKADGYNWITLATGEYYPDILVEACELYKPVLVMFGQLVRKSESSTRLFLEVAEVPDGWMRVQLARVFRKYVSPRLPVEMLRRKSKAREICERFGTVFEDYPRPGRPLDFVVYDSDGQVLAIGLARYDSDRGGAQEDDRTGGYRNCADEILSYAQSHGLNTKVIFVNDGPGLLLGSMWDDYASLEQSWPGRILVVTLRMIPERITLDWLRS
jgi:hypothetical protein